MVQPRCMIGKNQGCTYFRQETFNNPYSMAEHLATFNGTILDFGLQKLSGIKVGLTLFIILR